MNRNTVINYGTEQGCNSEVASKTVGYGCYAACANEYSDLAVITASNVRISDTLLVS